MNLVESYLKKHAFRQTLINTLPNTNLGMVIVIPAYNEESILQPLKALSNCVTPIKSVEVIVVFNASEEDSEEILQKNINALSEAKSYYSLLQKPFYDLHFIVEHHLPKKHAGVGLARKIGMDEAARRLAHINKIEAPIICFDADSSCEVNYLKAIENHFNNFPETSAASIHFEHPLDGDLFSSEVYKGINFYELHLRYYKNALAFANLPYAFHTIGSSMAVRTIDYCKQGGMNKRKAGEDFYFLQKFIKLGNFSEIKDTMVIPSPRVSDRVPFGTGRAIKEMLEKERSIEMSYAFKSFRLIKEALQSLENWYNGDVETHQYFIEFVGKEKLLEKVEEIRRQSSNQQLFVKRFFHWFDAFQCLKFVHFLRDQYYPNEELNIVVPKLLNEVGLREEFLTEKDLLLKLRELDRN